MKSTALPRSPQFETPASRLAELIQLLAEVPFSHALAELPADVDGDDPSTDPLWVVAGALVRLRRASPNPAHAIAPVPV